MNLWWACDITRPALLHIRYKDKDGDFVNLNKDDRWFLSDVCSCQFSRWILESTFEYQWATFTSRSMDGTRQKTKASRNVYSCVGNWTKARSSVIREKVCECCIIYQKSRVITIRLHKTWISQNHSVKESIVIECGRGIGQGHLRKWCAHSYLHFLIKDLWKPSQINYSKDTAMQNQSWRHQLFFLRSKCVPDSKCIVLSSTLTWDLILEKPLNGKIPKFDESEDWQLPIDKR